MRSFKIAFCGVMTGLSLAFMLLTGVIPIGAYVLPAFAGLVIAAVYIEAGSKWAILSYASTSVLSVFLAGDKEAVILFILFFGYYPMVNIKSAQIPYKIVRSALKLVIFNTSVVLSYLLVEWLLGIPDDALVIFGVSLPMVLLLVGNIVFLLYDYSIDGIIPMYKKHFRPIMHKVIKPFDGR